MVSPVLGAPVSAGPARASASDGGSGGGSGVGGGSGSASGGELLASILEDEALRRREFPVTSRLIYLAHAAVCPLPARVADAISGYVARASEEGQFEHLHKEAEESARALAASMIGASPDEIAFVPSTSAGLSTVAAGLPWREGDSVVIPEGDFPSNVYPWLGLSRRGVRVKRIPKKPTGLVDVTDVEAALDDRTRLVSLSSVHFSTGAAAPVEAIGARLRERGVLFCLDAIQSLGALPCSSRDVDFLTADAHKWLLGPQGIGVLYVRRERMRELFPPMLGWKSAASERDYLRDALDLKDDARRYEPGSLSAVGVVGLAAALSLLLEVGAPHIEDRLARLRSMLVRGLMERGYKVAGPLDGAPTTITSFHEPGGDAVALQKKLLEARIITSVRSDPMGQPCVRVAPHFYTTEAEIQALLGALGP